jgi:hypothetical protein
VQPLRLHECPGLWTEVNERVWQRVCTLKVPPALGIDCFGGGYCANSADCCGGVGTKERFDVVLRSCRRGAWTH